MDAQNQHLATTPVSVLPTEASVKCIRQMAILCLFWLPQPPLFLSSTLTQLAKGSGFYHYSCNFPCRLMLQYTYWYLYVCLGCYFCQVICVGRTDTYATCLACQKLQDVTAKMLVPSLTALKVEETLDEAEAVQMYHIDCCGGVLALTCLQYLRTGVWLLWESPWSHTQFPTS